MSRLIPTLAKDLRRARYYSQSTASSATPKLTSIKSIVSTLDAIDVTEFREKAFIPEEPILITAKQTRRPWHHSLPAAEKWFVPGSQGDGCELPRAQVLSRQYLTSFADVILPYELITPTDGDIRSQGGDDQLAYILSRLLAGSNGTTFHRFDAPLSLFLQTSESNTNIHPQRLYIAQAQIACLPKQLQDDLPTPRIVREAGKGDVYDANIWLGTPPTYTPLHKDPNPNLFVQLAGKKLIRLFRPSDGSAIFRAIQEKNGQVGPASFRGREMMEEPERGALHGAVWGPKANRDGFEAIVGPEDALFIPKGWWHSIRSVGNEVNASVNWWFR